MDYELSSVIEYQHSIPVRAEAVAHVGVCLVEAQGLLVRFHDEFVAAEGTGEHEQGAVGQVEVCYHGICDVDSLIVTEIKFTRRVLNDLNKKGYDISKFKYGEKIPEDFIEKVFCFWLAGIIIACQTKLL